jgi:hypothetical protein
MGAPRRFSVRKIFSGAVALFAVAALGLVASPHPAAADTGDSWAYPGRLDDGLSAARLDRCRLGFIAQAGGPAERTVALNGLTGTTAQLHAAADPDYWNDTPLDVAYKQDQTARETQWDALYDRHNVWTQSIPGTFDLPTETTTGFQWAPDFYAVLGITGFYVDQFFNGEDGLYDDLAATASSSSLATATDLAKQQHLYLGSEVNSSNIDEAFAWEAVGDYDAFDNGEVWPGNHHADDIREFLQDGGWPKVAPDPSSADFRLEVENIKQRFSSCDTDNPLDPDHVLAPVVHTAAAEWQAELDSQATQRAAIMNAQVKAYNDLEATAVAMGEAVGQSWIAGQLSKWQAYWSPGGPGTAGSGPMTVKAKSATTICLDNTSSSTANNNKIEAYTCNSSAAQGWKPGGTDYLDGSLINLGANKCLDLSGTNVVLYACTSGKANQHWQYTTTGGQTRLYNVGANKCLNLSTTKGTQATVVACSTSATGQQLVTTQDNTGTSTGTDDMFYPKPADFTYAVTEIKNSQTRAAAQLVIANNASADAQTQATVVTNAQTAANAIATAHNYPVGRGLAYAQQSAQVVKASAAGALAAATATNTATQATKAAVSDSATLIALAQTQSAAMQADYAKAAAQEAERQAHSAAQSAAAEATAAAADAVTAKAKRAVAEQAEATARTAAAKAAQQRQIAEQQRQIAADQRAIAESKHAIAASADADAQQQQGLAAQARTAAEADEQTAADRDLDAQTSAGEAQFARETAQNAKDAHDSLVARAEALQAKADAAVGTADADAARAAANAAQAQADNAQTAADTAGHDADVATEAAEDARSAATAAHAAAARADAAADKADAQVAITRSAAATAHSAAADALAASNDAKQHANSADADAAKAEADAAAAKQDSLNSLAAAQLAQSDSAVTAGQAYATSLAAVAARDSALQVTAPANDAVGLGAPYAEKDSSAALAVLVGQGSLTVAQQQSAAAQARADEAATAATNAAALAASATGDAKIAAQAAADAAADASAAAKSARDAHASAAAAAVDAAGAAVADAATAQLNAQAEQDAAAAHTAATAAAGDADAADSEAAAAELNAESARAAAAQAATDAQAAQQAADQADAYADDAEKQAANARADAAAAEQAADQAEAAARDSNTQSQVVSTWDGGYAALLIRQSLTVDAWSGSCSTGGGSPTCDIDVPLHMHGTVLYDLVICTLVSTTQADCVDQPLGTAPIDLTVHRTLHMDARVAIKASWDNLVHLTLGDFISCGQAISKGTVNVDCAWAAAQLIPYARLAEWVKAIVGVDDALRAGSGIAKAMDLAKASDLPAEVLPSLGKAVDEATTLVPCALNVLPSVARTVPAAQKAAATADECPVAALSPVGQASYKKLLAAVLRVRGSTAAQFRSWLSPGQLAAGQEEPWLRSMYLGSVIENQVAADAAVSGDSDIAHLGTTAPGQAVADFVITDGTNSVNIDVTGSSQSSISKHLGRAYIESRDQILDYSSFDNAFLDDVYK